MDIHQEQFSDHGRNAIQMALAEELYGKNILPDDELMNKWIIEGYARRFGDFLNNNPGIEEKILLDQDSDAIRKLKQDVLFH